MKSPTYITTSWDDGHPMDLRVAALLAKYGIAGTFYVPASTELGAVSAAQLREWPVLAESLLRHLIILLDAPPGVFQARKQEPPFEETARQREAYLSLMKTMKNGHVVDAARSLEHVVRDVNDIILRHLTMRIARRLGLEQNMVHRAQTGRASQLRNEAP